MPPRDLAPADFIRGSSDYPTIGSIPKQTPINYQEIDIGTADMSARILKSDGSLNVEKTNAVRARAFSNSFPAMKLVRQALQYRRIVRDENRLITGATYSRVHPKPLETLVNIETVTGDIAAKYLGVNPEDVRQLIVSGQLEGKIYGWSTNVVVANLVNYKNALH